MIAATVTRRRFTAWKLTPSLAGADQTLRVPKPPDSNCRYENAVKHKDIRFLSLSSPNEFCILAQPSAVFSALLARHGIGTWKRRVSYLLLLFPDL